MRKISTTIIFLLAMIFTATGYCQNPPPKLIVQLVIDQLRGDLIDRYQNKFGEGGFNYLINNSLWYTNAFHPHAKTTTCVGHTTIATGTTPAYHGIIGNNWYSREKNKEVYCLADDSTPILATPRTKITIQGHSPKNIMTTTLSDEIILEQKGRVFGVSLKDRGAITLAGHGGKAFWFDKTNGGFVTSRYYYSRYPNWVNQWNQQQSFDKFQQWNLLKPIASYRYPDIKINNKNHDEFGDSFPHCFSHDDGKTYYKTLSMSPFADQVTADFSQRLLIEEKLGQSKSANTTDYLSISFSSTDGIGHNFGPNSLEAEDNLLRLDKTLATLFATIDKQVGLKNTLIVLTADHGVSDTPEYLKKKGIPSSRLNIRRWIKQQLPQLIKQRFNIDHAITAYSKPVIYLDHQAIKKSDASVKQVSDFIIHQLSQIKGIAGVYDMNALANNQVEHNFLSTKVATMNYQSRRGDLYIVPNPYVSLVYAKNPDKVSHGTPWNYDAYVPILFARPGFNQRITRKVYTTDIAPTLASLLHIKPPAASIGNVLNEVME